jgi:hypothetical protein
MARLSVGARHSAVCFPFINYELWLLNGLNQKGLLLISDKLKNKKGIVKEKGRIDIVCFDEFRCMA